MEKTDEVLGELITRLTTLGYDKLPKILESSAEITRLEGITQAIAGSLLIVAAIFAARKGNKFHEEKNDISIVLWVASGGFGLFGGIALLSESIWIKMISPEAYLYKQLLFTTLN